VGGDEHIYGGERLALLPASGAEIGVSFCRGGIPREGGYSQQELIHELGELIGLRLQGKAEEKFGFGYARNADLGHGNLAQMFADGGRISSQSVTHGVSVQQEPRHGMVRLLEPRFLGRAAVALAEKVFGDFHGIGEGEEVVPGFRLAGEDDVAGFRILSDEDLAAGEAERGRQADGLAAPIFEKFGGFLHAASSAHRAARALGIYHSISQPRKENGSRDPPLHG
jgi:hypothetical protein